MITTKKTMRILAAAAALLAVGPTLASDVRYDRQAASVNANQAAGTKGAKAESSPRACGCRDSASPVSPAYPDPEVNRRSTGGIG